jgi:hypothetical protein
MKLKTLLKVLRPYQYIRITQSDKKGSLDFGKIILVRNFPTDSLEMNCKVLAVISNIGHVQETTIDFLSIIIEKEGKQND